MSAKGVFGMNPLQIPNLRRRVSGATVAAQRDLSRPQFSLGRNDTTNVEKVGEILYALPMVKANGLELADLTQSAEKLSFDVTHPSAALPDPAFYDDSGANPPSDIFSLALEDPTATALTRLDVARIGVQFRTPKIDLSSTPRGAAFNQFEWRAQAAATAVLRKVNKMVAQGDPTPFPRSFRGLKKLAVDWSRRQAATFGANAEAAVRDLIANVYPAAHGAGAGPDCLIGGTRGMRRLMTTNSGQRGMSGFRVDARTGLFLYHYMGIPFYRTEVEASGTPLSEPLYAANLGPSGLHLVYAYGTPDTFGLTLEELPSAQEVGSLRFMTHGSYALAAWDKEAIYEVTIEVTSL